MIKTVLWTRLSEMFIGPENCRKRLFFKEMRILINV